MRGVSLKPWELRALLATDKSYLRRCGEIMEEENKKNSDGTLRDDVVSDQPLTPELFDRAFSL